MALVVLSLGHMITRNGRTASAMGTREAAPKATGAGCGGGGLPGEAVAGHAPGLCWCVASRRGSSQTRAMVHPTQVRVASRWRISGRP